MANPAQLWLETWVVAADEIGPWLISGGTEANAAGEQEWVPGPWLPGGPLMSDGEAFADVKLMLHGHNIPRSDIRVLHQTSSRFDPRGFGVWTFMAEVDPRGLVLSRWPDALPVTVDAAGVAGKPLRHGAADAPTPRLWDVFAHGLRHLAELAVRDDDTRGGMSDDLLRYLSPLEPDLYRLLGDLYHHREAA